MAQFDVFENPSQHSKKRVPYLLDVQADLLSSLETRVVVPLARLEVMKGHSMDRLTPELKLLGTVVIMMTPQIAGVHRSALGRRVDSMEGSRSEIIGALDMLLTGV